LNTQSPIDPLSSVKQAAYSALLMNLNGTMWGFALYKAAKEYNVDEEDIAKHCGRPLKKWSTEQERQFND